MLDAVLICLGFFLCAGSSYTVGLDSSPISTHIACSASLSVSLSISFSCPRSIAYCMAFAFLVFLFHQGLSWVFGLPSLVVCSFSSSLILYFYSCSSSSPCIPCQLSISWSMDDRVWSILLLSSSIGWVSSSLSIAISSLTSWCIGSMSYLNFAQSLLCSFMLRWRLLCSGVL